MTDREQAYQAMMRALGALNPLAVLARGYAAVTDAEKKTPIYGVKDMKPDQEITLRMHDGCADCTVCGVQERGQ